ncbi:hypothetical protein [Metamycoplasma equirhinis]|uniref:hypothetical protein n=1 Tax=Metamycoplasma equirhinis TaxID=92402 RepID=UPI0035942D59
MKHNNTSNKLIYVSNISRFKKDQVRKLSVSNNANEYQSDAFEFEMFLRIELFANLVALASVSPAKIFKLLELG